MRRPPHLGACGIGHVLGSCIMVVPAYASDNTGLEFQQFIDEFAGKKDFIEFMVNVAAFIVSVAAAAFAYHRRIVEKMYNNLTDEETVVECCR